MGILADLLKAIVYLSAYWPTILFALIGFWLLSNYFQNGLHRIPGPFLRSISTLPRIWSVYNNRSHEDDILLHRKYGKMVRLAPNLVSISDTNEISTIYGISSKFYKSYFYDLSSAQDEEGVIPDTFVLRDRDLHSRMKRNAANAYSVNGLIQMEPWIEPVTVRLLAKLDKYADSNDKCDIGDIIKNYAMDAVFAITFGKDLDYLEKGDTTGMFRIVDVITDYMAILGQIAWCHPYLLGNPTIAGLFFGSDEGQADMLLLAKNQSDEAKLNLSEDGPMTFLQRLVLNQKANPKSINDRELNTHTWGNIAAGSDTTAIAMRSVLTHLLKHPDVQAKLLLEVQENLTIPVGFAKANQLPYLQAVIREAMRLHPSVGMLLGRIVPAGGATIGTYPIKAGAEVGMNPWVLHRDPEVFPDPDRFWPERWLVTETSEAHLKQMNNSFFAFGHGAHTCSGRWISLMEVVKLIPTLMLKYDMKLVDGGKTIDFKNRWFTPQKGLLVKITKRQ